MPTREELFQKAKELASTTSTWAELGRKVNKSLGVDLSDGVWRGLKKNFPGEVQEIMGQMNRPVVEGVRPQEGSPPFDVVYEKMIKQFQRRAELEERKINQKITFPNEPVAVAFLADLHFGSSGVNYERIFREGKLISDTPNMYAMLVGDLVDNFILQKMLNLRLTISSTPVDEWTLVTEYVKLLEYKLLGVVGGNHECMDGSTECLTKRGWLHYTDILPSDQVLSIDPQGYAVWTSIYQIIRRSDNTELYYLNNYSVDMAVTGRHRILHRTRVTENGVKVWSDVQYTEAKHLTKGRIRIPVSGFSKNEDYPLSDDEIRLAAWVLTDGHMDKGTTKGERVRIYQRESKHKMITEILDRLGYKYSLRRRIRSGQIITGYHVQSAETEVVIDILSPFHRLFRERVLQNKEMFPKWIWELSDRQADIFLRSMADGDGSVPDHCSNGTYAFYGRRVFVESLQMFCVQHGYSASLYTYKDRVGKDQYRLNINKRDSVQLDLKGKWSTETYSGEVWCLSVPYTNFMVRRNGRAYFTGNCWTQKTTGIDPLISVLSNLDCTLLYDPDELYVNFQMGQQVWPALLRHKWRYTSILNPTHGVERAFERDQSKPFILGVGAHTHVSGLVREFNAGGETGLILQCGSYKEYDTYAKQVGFPKANRSAATVAIFHPEYGMSGYSSLYLAVDTLNRMLWGEKPNHLT